MMQDWIATLLGKAHDKVDALPMTSAQAVDIKKYTATIRNVFDDTFRTHMNLLTTTQEEVVSMRLERQRMLATYDRLYAITTETAERAIRAEIERDALKLIVEAK